MVAVSQEPLVGTDEFLKLLESAADEVALELIRGQVREFPMTTRNPRHSMAIARIGHVLLNWLDSQSDRVGVVASGETRCRIGRSPDTIVGIDVAYFEGRQFVELPDQAKYFDGSPVLAVEVLSPTDTHEEINDRIRILLAAGVQQVWIADPDFRTVTVHRPQAEQKLFTATQELSGDSELPGFACRVASLFAAGHNVGASGE